MKMHLEKSTNTLHTYSHTHIHVRRRSFTFGAAWKRENTFRNVVGVRDTCEVAFWYLFLPSFILLKPNIIAGLIIKYVFRLICRIPQCYECYKLQSNRPNHTHSMYCGRCPMYPYGVRCTLYAYVCVRRYSERRNRFLSFIEIRLCDGFMCKHIKDVWKSYIVSAFRPRAHTQRKISTILNSEKYREFCSVLSNWTKRKKEWFFIDFSFNLFIIVGAVVHRPDERIQNMDQFWFILTQKNQQK